MLVLNRDLILISERILKYNNILILLKFKPITLTF